MPTSGLTLGDILRYTEEERFSHHKTKEATMADSDYPDMNAFEEIITERWHELGCDAILVIDNTTLGPPLGGIRFKKYESKAKAKVDAIRLAGGMTLKSAAAELDLGGGKLVISIWDEKLAVKEEGLLQRIANFINVVNETRIARGKEPYWCAEDSGMNATDIGEISKYTKYVTGRPREMGGSGDPGPKTAMGLRYATLGLLNATHDAGMKTPETFSDLTIAVQGVGSVGYPFAVGSDELPDGEDVAASWRKVIFSEKLVERDGSPNECGISNAQRLMDALPQATQVDMNAIYSQECDIFAPCAFGGVLNEETIPLLNCRAVVGSANNQLRTPEDAVLLAARNILYLPDFLVNAGGVINVSLELAQGGYTEAVAIATISRIRDRVYRDVMESFQRTMLPRDVTVEKATRRLEAAKRT